MSMDRPTLEVVLSLIDQITAPLRGSVDGIKGILGDMKKEAETAIAGFFGFEAVKSLFEGVIAAGERMRESQNQLDQAFRNAGAGIEEYGAKAEDAISSVSDLSKYTDTELRGALARLVTQTGDANGSIANLGLVADIAAGKHITLEAATDIVSKAMEGNAGAVKRAGVAVNDLIPLTDQLALRFSGMAQAELDAAPAIDKVSKAWEGAKEAGAKFLVWLGGAIGKASEYMLTLDNTSGFDAIAREADEVDKSQAMLDKYVSMTKGAFDANLKTWQAEGAARVSEHQKAATTLQQAEDHLQAVLKQAVQTGADGQVRITQAGQDAIMVAEMAVGEARKAVADAVAKEQATAGKESAAAAKQTSDALKAVATDEQSVADLQHRVNDQFLKNFGDDVPAAVRETQVVIGDLDADIEKLRTKEATAQQAQIDAAMAGNHVLADAYGQEADQIEKTIDDLAQKRDSYARLIPVLTTIADFARQVSESEKDPAVPRTLDQINGQLAYALILRASVVGDVQAVAAIDAIIAGLTKDQSKAISDQDKNLKALGGTQNDVVRGIEAAHQAELKQLDATVSAVDATVELGSQLGIVDQQFASILESAIGVGQAIAHGDVAGAIGGFGSILVSLFGDSPENAARKALIEKNNEALGNLALINGRLVNLTDPGSNISAFQAIGNAASPGPFPAGSTSLGGFDSGASDSDYGYNGPISVAKLGGYLASKGLTLDEMRNLAKELGVDLGESNGTFSRTGVSSFIAAINEYKPTAFGDDFQGLVDSTTFNDKLAGNDSLSLQDWKNILGQTKGSPLLAAAFNGLDLNNPVDVQVLLGRLRQIASRASTPGGVSNDELNGLSIGQLISTIGSIGDLANPILAAAGLSPLAPVDTTKPYTGSPVNIGGVGGASLVTSSQVSGSVATTTTDLVTAITSGFKSVTDRLDTHTGQLEDVKHLLASIGADTAATASALANGVVSASNKGIQQQADLTAMNLGKAA